MGGGAAYLELDRLLGGCLHLSAPLWLECVEDRSRQGDQKGCIQLSQQNCDAGKQQTPTSRGQMMAAMACPFESLAKSPRQAAWLLCMLDGVAKVCTEHYGFPPTQHPKGAGCTSPATWDDVFAGSHERTVSQRVVSAGWSTPDGTNPCGPNPENVYKQAGGLEIHFW